MKKRKLVFLFAAAGVIILLAAGLLAMNYINGAKDYKKTLATGKEQAGAIIKKEAAAEEAASAKAAAEKAASGNTTATDLQKAGTEIEALRQAEQQEDAGIPAVAEVQVNEPEPLPTLAPHSGSLVNILFLGLDRTISRDKTLGVYRTDAMSLASVNLDTNTVEVLSIPRDTYVYIPKIGKKDKINHAYVWGGQGVKGISSTIDTVNRFIKYSTVDYYFCIDMEPVPEIIDLLGGVEVDVDVDMKTRGFNLSKGRQLLDGKKAKMYIGWRYSGAGDIDRVRRQQVLCGAMLNKLKESGQLLNSLKIVLGYNKFIKTNMNLQQMLSFATLASEIPTGATNFHIVSGSSAVIDKIWYWIPNEKKTDNVLKSMFPS